jgi:hypothetical protein
MVYTSFTKWPTGHLLTICPNMRTYVSWIFSNVIVLIIFSINLIFDDFDPIKTNAETSASLKVLSMNWRSPYLSVVLTPNFATRLQQIFVDLFIITKQLRTLCTEEIELNCGTIETRLGINQKPKKEHYCSSYTKWPKEYLCLSK